MSMIDKLILLVTVAFALSLVTEKTTQFIRDYTVKANYAVIALCFVADLILLRLLVEESVALGVSFTLIVLFIIKVVILILNYFDSAYLKKHFKDLRIYSLVRLSSVIFVLGITYLFGWFWGFLLLSNLLFLLACISLRIIKVSFNVFRTKDFNRQTFITIPNIEHRKIDFSKSKKSVNPDINFLAFIIGVLYASVFDIDIFSGISLDFDEIKADVVFSDLKIGDWIKTEHGEYITSDNLLTILSYVIVGFFLSFGSKFFHDLLDLLYATKRTRQALKDPSAYEQQDAESFQDFLENYQIHYHLNQKREDLHAINEIVGTSIVLKEINGKFYEHIEVCSSRENVEIKRFFNVNGSNGNSYNIPYTIKKVNGPAKLLNSISLSKTDLIFNSSKGKKSVGSFCVVVELLNDNEKYLLSCYHVVRGKTHEFERLDIRKGYRSVDQGSRQIGLVTNGKINSVVDAALVRLKGYVDLSEFESRPLDKKAVPNRLKENTNVYVLGQKTKEKRLAKITNVDKKYAIDYSGHKSTTKYGTSSHELSYLFSVNDDRKMGVSTFGDSGGCIYNAHSGVPIGMIVAKEDVENGNTIAIPLYHILQEFQQIKSIYPLKL